MNALAVVPIFRIFDVRKARHFYIDYLGFSVDWEHRLEDSMPLYISGPAWTPWGERTMKVIDSARAARRLKP